MNRILNFSARDMEEQIWNARDVSAGIKSALKKYFGENGGIFYQTGLNNYDEKTRHSLIDKSCSRYFDASLGPENARISTRSTSTLHPTENLLDTKCNIHLEGSNALCSKESNLPGYIEKEMEKLGLKLRYDSL